MFSRNFFLWQHPVISDTNSPSRGCPRLCLPLNHCTLPSPPSSSHQQRQGLIIEKLNTKTKDSFWTIQRKFRPMKQRGGVVTSHCRGSQISGVQQSMVMQTQQKKLTCMTFLHLIALRNQNGHLSLDRLLTPEICYHGNMTSHFSTLLNLRDTSAIRKTVRFLSLIGKRIWHC